MSCLHPISGREFIGQFKGTCYVPYYILPIITMLLNNIHSYAILYRWYTLIQLINFIASFCKFRFYIIC